MQHFIYPILNNWLWTVIIMLKQEVTLSWGKKKNQTATKSLLHWLFPEKDKTSHKSSNCFIYTPGNSREDCSWSGAIPHCRDYGLAEFWGYIIFSQEKDSFMQLLCFLFMVTYWSKQGMPSEKQIVLQGTKSTAYLSVTAHRPFFDSVMRRGHTYSKHCFWACYLHHYHYNH